MKNHSFIMRTTTLFPSKLAALAGAVLVTGALALLVGAFTDQAMAQNPGGGGSAQSFAVGGFTTSTTLERVAFAAHNNPKKPGVYAGHVVQEYMDGTSTSGPVTCMLVGGGTQALVSFRIDHGANPGTYRTFAVEDRGQPNGQTFPDGYFDCGPSNGTCDCNGGFAEFIAKGNIVVSP